MLFRSLKSKVHGQEVRRSYSICSTPQHFHKTGEIDIGVRQVDGGVFSTWANESLRAGDVFGEIGFIRATQRTADVRALGPVSVLRFDHARLEKDLALFPNIMAKLNFNISGILGQRLAEMVEARQAEAAKSAAPRS